MKSSDHQIEQKYINIQFQPSRCRGTKTAEIVSRIKQFSDDSYLVDSYKTSENTDEDYLNLFLATHDLIGLWSELKEFLFTKENIKKDILAASIVICEGNDGWNDYLLLYHYDSEVPVDELISL